MKSLFMLISLMILNWTFMMMKTWHRQSMLKMASSVSRYLLLCKRYSFNLRHFYTSPACSSFNVEGMRSAYRNMGSHRESHKRDGLPKSYELVYRAPMTGYVQMCKWSSYFTVTAGVAALALQFETTLSVVNANIFQASIIALGFAGMNSLLLSIVYRYPVRMYYVPEKDKYLAVFVPWLPNTKRHVRIHPGEPKLNQGTLLLPWNEHRYELCTGFKILLLSDFFRYPADFNHLLGYDKDDE